MTQTLKKTLAGLTVAALMFMGAASVKAATMEDLQDQIDALLAQLAGLSGNSSCTATYNHTVTLMVGSKGAQVSAMQAVVGATADGNFGPMTKSKVMAFQASKGLTADGVVGAMTGAALHTASTANCDDNGDDNNDNNGDLSGTDGSIQLVTELTQWASEEVGEGQDDVEVLGFDLETTNDGDIMVRSIKVSFDPAGNTGSDNLDDYLTGVTVWMDGEEVGSADVEDFSQDSSDIWSRTITLSDSIVREDSTEEFIVSVDSANTIDSGDISGDSWTVDVESVRYEDGSGVVTTDTDGEINGMDVPISFVTFSAASDTELKLSTHEDNPEAGIVVASNTGTTDDVVLLKGELELEGDSDVLLDEFPVTFAPTTSNFNVMVSSIKLIIDGEEYSESVPSIAAAATASITFNDLDLTIDAGDTIEFEVVAEIADTDDFTAGSTITASVTSTNRGHMDVENEQGDNLAAGEKSGTVGGEAQEFRANGISVDLVGTPTATKSSSDTNNGDTATFEIKFKITAVGDDMYVATTASTSGAANNLYAVDYSGTATTTDVTGVLTNDTDAAVTSGLYLIEEGESETFTLTVLRSPSDTDDLFRAKLTSIKWDDEAGDTTPDNNYTTNLDDFKTGYVALD